MKSAYIFLSPHQFSISIAVEILQKLYKAKAISSRDIFREEIKGKTPLGLKMEGFMSLGQLVPNEVITELFESKLKKESQNIIIVHYPRTPDQSEKLFKLFNNYDFELKTIWTLELRSIDQMIDDYFDSPEQQEYNKETTDLYNLIKKL